MKLQELKLHLNEDITGKNDTLFDEHDDEISSYVKKQLYDIRKGEKGEKVKITMAGIPKATKTIHGLEYVVRLHDDVEQVKVIDEYELKRTYEQIQADAKEDAEGFIVYRQIGEYEAFKYAGEEVYIFTDWNTKQRLKTGDYLVRDVNKDKSSGFVVPAADFDKHFEELK